MLQRQVAATNVVFLLAMSESNSPPPLPEPTLPRTRSRWLVLVILLPFVGGIFGLLIAGMSGYLAPKTYESAGLMQVHPPGPDLDPIAGGEREAAPTSKSGARFMATEFEVIRAPKTLHRVVDRLDLTQRWGSLTADEIVENLAAMVSVGLVRS